MSSLLQLQNGAKAYGSKTLFEGASFSINEGDHVGVIGPNGAGKTTLFKILIGQETLDSGRIIRSQALRLGYLSQHDAWKDGETVESFLEGASILPLWELKRLARGLGLTPELFTRPITALSGGYRMRVKLLSLIGQEPNLMLLDEPTNYLDLETLVVLENFLQGYAGAFLLISHDREFLKRTASQTLEIEQGSIAQYPGDIDDYFEQKALLRSQLEARAQSLAEKRQTILDFVARFGAKATKASQAQSRLKTLAKMESIELKPFPVRAQIRLPAPERSGKQHVGKRVLELKHADLGYPERTVLNDATLQIQNGDHVAVVGLNGAGKSTLLRSLAGQLPLRKGALELGYEITTGYYAQHVGLELEAKLGPRCTVLEALEAGAPPSVTRQDALDLAGSLLFSGDAVKKTLSVLSGGEKARVALGRILLMRASCLILDEPTNHLDFDTVEALTQALMVYPGTVILVSHDRSFVRRVGTRILEVDRGQVAVHHGTYDDYVWRIQRQVLEVVSPEAPAPKVPASASPDGKSEHQVSREAKKAAEKELRQTQRAIQAIEPEMAKLSREISDLNDRLLRVSGAEAATLITDLNALQVKLHKSEEQWMELSEKAERLKSR